MTFSTCAQVLAAIAAIFSTQGDATSVDYVMRDILRALFSPAGVAMLGTAVSVRAWRRAMAAEGYGVEAWSIDRGLKGHAYVSRQLAGEKPIAFEHIEAAPVAVQRWYHLFRLEEIGVPSVVETAGQVASLLKRTA